MCRRRCRRWKVWWPWRRSSQSAAQPYEVGAATRAIKGGAVLRSTRGFRSAFATPCGKAQHTQARGEQRQRRRDRRRGERRDVERDAAGIVGEEAVDDEEVECRGRGQSEGVAIPDRGDVVLNKVRA